MSLQADTVFVWPNDLESDPEITDPDTGRFTTFRDPDGNGILLLERP